MSREHSKHEESLYGRTSPTRLVLSSRTAPTEVSNDRCKGRSSETAPLLENEIVWIVPKTIFHESPVDFKFT